MGVSQELRLFSTVVEPCGFGAPRPRAALAAILVHALILVTAVSSTSSHHPGARSPARDTIHLALIPEPESSPRASADHPRSGPDMVLPRPPSIPDIPLGAPDFQQPSLSFMPPIATPSPAALIRGAPGEAPMVPDSAGPVLSAAGVDELPELVGELRPRYPDQLRRAGLSGAVHVEYVVDVNGKVEGRIRVRDSSHPLFLESALQALRGARFRPARRAGRSVPVLVQQTIRFQVR